MRIPLIIVAMFGLMLSLVGCSGTNTDPYKPLDAIVKGDDIAITDATVAVTDGLLPKQDAAAIYTGEQTFVTLGIPPLVQGAALLGSPTAAGAITLAVLDGDIQTLTTDVAALHSAITAAVEQTIKVARLQRASAARPAPKP